MRATVPVGTLLLFLAVVYVLGIGPAYWLFESGRMSRGSADAMEVFYTPLALAAENNRTVGLALERYVEWWTPPAPPAGTTSTLAIPQDVPGPVTSVPAGTIPSAPFPPALRPQASR
jgi:hypothetical protein